MKHYPAILAAAIVTTVSLSGSAMAQSSDQNSQQKKSQASVQRLDRQAVRGFFNSMQNDISSAVENGDSEQLVNWMRDHVANSATFTGLNSVNLRGQQKIVISAQLDKQDLIAMQRFALSSHDMSGDLQDYNLRIQVTGMQPIGNSAALVRTRISESGTMGRGQPRVAQSNENFGDMQGFQDMQGFEDQDQSSNQDLSSNQDQSASQGRKQSSSEEWNQSSDRQASALQNVNFKTQSQCTHLLTLDAPQGQIELGSTSCVAVTNLGSAGRASAPDDDGQ